MGKRQINLNHLQRGMMLIVLVFMLGIAATAYMVHALNGNTVRIERDKKTAAALAEAKAALIGWSAGHATMPGVLPCPDTSNTGIKGTCTASLGIIGRLPWKTLGINDLRDGNGECLWYALSPLYRNTITVGSRVSNPINSNIPGTITVKGADGTNFPAPVNPAIAVIIAPGAPLAGQDRSSASSTVCGGNTTTNNYLDTALGVNNATGNVSGSNYTFIAGAASDTFNDRLIYITADEFYRTVRKRMVKEVLGNVEIHAGPVKYFDTNTTYPCPATTPTGSSDCSLTSGFVNNSGMGLQYAALGSWLANNGWFALTTYSYTGTTHVKAMVADALGSHSCDANLNVFTCASP
ncbi:MAG: hypothetical protein A3B82_01075 [Methylophilales bacterium RIFCSPHIGHO2_02_FULL_57_10]|nr:MAG: hypothetical protein A3B82_01075 [Methylophilales bacterium RIFCSPHIGHO2_02_FULL_57_10]